MSTEETGAGPTLEGEIQPTGASPTIALPGPARPDPVTAAVLAALDQVAEQHLTDHRPHKTKTGYARDWALWIEYLDWLAPRAGHRLPDTAVTTGTLVGFVIWLDAEKAAAMSSIERRIAGVTVTCRREHRVEAPKAATAAAREKLKQLRNDPELGAARRASGRGQAPATTPDQLRAMNTAPRLIPRATGSRRRRREYLQPELARLRDRALSTMSFAIAGRASQVSALDTLGITLESRGLRVVVPPVKGEEERTVVVGYGEHEDSCPVRC
ncbi:hypothetical protein AB0D08_30670 [Kitasatospora sp. NPDC048540]|uniref:hypothetical protein n=1 Tax=Kitasatospora sp. NPDC048540 TaxID=3155634 RepID=UPI0033EA0CEE